MTKGKKHHRWDNNICIKCGLIRKQRALWKNLNGFYGKYMYDYKVENEWIPYTVGCK